MRRKTKPRVVWLPATNAASLGDTRNGIQRFQITVSPLGGLPSRAQAEISCIIDGNPSVLTAATLDDVENNGYRLRRIVGKIFVAMSQSGGATAFPNAIVTAGLIIRRVAPQTGTSLAALDVTGQQVDTQDLDNWGDPWIWRRSWLLSDASSGQLADADAPFTNAEYGSVADGPHVDAKTARIVGPEERLFLDVTAQTFGIPGATADSDSFFNVYSDLRCLASMRTGVGNRRNASR